MCTHNICIDAVVNLPLLKGQLFIIISLSTFKAALIMHNYINIIVYSHVAEHAYYNYYHNIYYGESKNH